MVESPSPTANSEALPYAVSPGRLLLNDLFIILKNIKYVPGIILPLLPINRNPLNELSAHPANYADLFFHFILIVTQIAFLASLPLALFLPASTFLVYFIGVLLLNYVVCLKFNGPSDRLFEAVPDQTTRRDSVARETEKWIFINGVSVGHHWLQNNLQRLANTFRRKIVAVHNPTAGILFDLIQCLIERDFQYNVSDVRQGYAYLKEQLLDDDITKVVLILHSQGGIEGGMIVDWLLADLPNCRLRKLEVYTFGNAANHFNNPVRYPRDEDGSNPHKEVQRIDRVIGHIEHYANSGDFVARFGVLNFTGKTHTRKRIEDGTQESHDRFVGIVFKRHGSGHMLNQHYLDNMFTMAGDRVADGNPFMDSYVRPDNEFLTNHPESHAMFNERGRLMIKQMSRLWQYRNGGSPEEK